MNRLFLIVVTALFSLNAFAANGSVYFKSPKNGATVSEKFKVVFGVKKMKLRPAGESPDDQTLGHHHLLIDSAAIPQGQVVPADATHIHFGKAQTETEITLTPGKHKLTLQFADGAHRSYGEALSKTIEVTVK